MEDSEKLFSSTDGWNLAAITAIPVLLALVNPSWLYDLPGQIDSANYLGLFMYYDLHLEDYELCYKISRTPWILTGYLAFATFPPMVAHYFLVIFSLGGFLVLFYLTLRLHKPQQISFLTTACLAVYCYLHHNGGWYYHNLMGYSFFLLSMIALFRWRSVKGILSSGFFLLAAIQTNFILFNFGLVWLLYYFLIYVKPVKEVALDFALAAAGGIIGLVFWMGLSGLTGSDPWNFLLQIQHVLCFMMGQEEMPQKTSVLDALGQSYHLVFPMVLMVWAFFKMIKKPSKGLSSIVRDFPHLLALVLVMVLHLIWEFRGSATLHLRHSFNIVGPAFLAFGHLLSFFLTKRASDGLLGNNRLILVLILVMPLAVGGHYIQFTLDPTLGRMPIVMAIVLASVGLFWKVKKLSSVIIVIGFSLFNLFITDNGVDYGVWTRACSQRGDIQKIEIKAAKLIQEIDHDLSGRIWFNPKEMVRLEGINCPIPQASNRRFAELSSGILGSGLGYGRLLVNPPPESIRDIPDEVWERELQANSCGCLYPYKPSPTKGSLKKLIVMTASSVTSQDANTYLSENGWRIQDQVKLQEGTIRIMLDFYERD